MHVQTHILSGWCAANVPSLTPRERGFAMLAATLADLDGLGIVFGEEFYFRYHHKLGHNLAFGLLLATLLTAFSRNRRKSFFLYIALFHLHLLLDYFGSGPGWPIYYLWPFSQRTLVNPNAWEFNSWQNRVAALAFLIWTIAIAVRCGALLLRR